MNKVSSKKKYSQTREELVLKLINRKEPQAVKKTKGKFATEPCVYNQDFNGGCAIGCDVRPSLSRSMPQGSVEYREVFDELPKRLRDMGSDFLHKVQRVHDNVENWNDTKSAKLLNGLVWNELGVMRINQIIDKFELKIDKINQ